jgi:fatty acid desaturase
VSNGFYRSSTRELFDGKSPESKESAMATLLWILAVVLVVAGIFAIIRKQLLWGIVLIVIGLLVGPGGVSIFT